MPLTKVSSGVIAANAVVDSFGTQSITGDKLGLTAINANNIVNGSITGAKIALGTITGDDIATGQITGNLLTANCVSGNNIVSSPTITGNVIINGSLGIGGATPASSGFGITFPATQSASTDANTLDDYEEGTWTPGYTPGNGSSSIRTQIGTYTKVGRMVCVCFQLEINVGSSTIIGSITGLPFTVSVAGPSNVTATGREYYSLGSATQFVTTNGGTSMQLIFFNNTTAITGGATILGWGGTFTYFV